MRFCPHCGSDLSMYLNAGHSVQAGVAPGPSRYDQTKTWREIMRLANERKAHPPQPEFLIRHIIRTGGPGPHESIVHIAFDRDVVPRGGALRELSLTEGRSSLDADRLAAMGYALEGGKVKLVNEVPVGTAYQVLDYWGGEKQHRRWHLEKPVTIETSRNSDPYFMDDSMVAFGATWSDDLKFEEAFYELIELFDTGIGKQGRVALPLVINVFWSS